MANWKQKRFELALNGNIEADIEAWFEEQKLAGYQGFPNISQVTSRGHERWITITQNNAFALPNGYSFKCKLFRIFPDGLTDFLTWVNSYTTQNGTLLSPVCFSIETGESYVVAIVIDGYAPTYPADGQWFAKLFEVGANADGMQEQADWLSQYDSLLGYYSFAAFDYGTLNFVFSMVTQ